MKNIFSFLFGLGLLIAAPASAQARVNVFACEPEWGALAKEVGGDAVDVYTATKATQDVHHMRAKPSLLAQMRKADIVFCSGASLESGWLPILTQKAGGPDVQPNTIGWIMASDYVQKLEVMEKADRSMGHVHPEGNPHVHLNPEYIVHIADILADRLYQIDGQNASVYAANLDTFKQRWNADLTKWKAQAAQLKGTNVIVHHKNWAYLTDWAGINVVNSLEPKPGLPPTTAHLESLLQSVKTQKVSGILVAPFENDEAAQWLSGKTGIPVLHLPYTVGGNDRAQTLKSMFDETFRMLSEAAS